MDKNQIIARLQQLWRRSVTDEFTPTSEMIFYWLKVYDPTIIRDAIRVLANYLQKHKMPGDECIRYLGATMRNMRNQLGNIDLSKIVIGRSASENDGSARESEFHDAGPDRDRFGWPPCNDDYSDLKLD